MRPPGWRAILGAIALGSAVACASSAAREPASPGATSTSSVSAAADAADATPAAGLDPAPAAGLDPAPAAGQDAAPAPEPEAPADAENQRFAADLSRALPRFASGDAPVYPRMSRRIGEEGWVEIAIDVKQDGEVVGLAIAASSGSARLDAAALTAARTWRFLPRTGARGVDRLSHRIVFRLTRG